jgi:primase-polymerase (primpol)-like protein
MTSILRENIPPELRGPHQWVFWRFEVREGKPVKVPITAMGYKARVNDPNTWSRLDHLLSILHQRPEFADGVGFVVTSADPFCGIDLDDCLNDAGSLKPWAQALCGRFADCYAEVTPSGSGLRIWCRARLPRALKRSLPDGGLELYDDGRYFTVTANRFNNAPLELVDHQADIEEILRYFGAHTESSGSSTPGSRICERIPAGQRYPTFVSIAGTLVKRGVCDEAITAIILAINEHQTEEPKSDAEVRNDIRKILTSARGWD